MDEIITLLTSQWLIIVASPIPFALCSSLFFGLGYCLVKLLYRKKLQRSKQHQQALREELARLEMILADERDNNYYFRTESEALRAAMDNISGITVGDNPKELENSFGIGAIQKQMAGHGHVRNLQSTNLFLGQPEDNIENALKKAATLHKLVFAVIYDPDHPTKSNLAYTLGYFLQYQKTRKLVDQYFISCTVPISNKRAKVLVPMDDVLDNCRWVVLNSEGEVLRSESLFANPDEGLSRTQEVIAMAESSPA